MPKRLSIVQPAQRPSDVNQLAHILVRESTEDMQPIAEPIARRPVSLAVSKVMAQMGSRGGKIGGKRRLETLSSEMRSQIASDAAKARWAKRKHN
jgi:hypothetical protein